jgi:hypothetical protein
MDPGEANHSPTPVRLMHSGPAVTPNRFLAHAFDRVLNLESSLPYLIEKH